MRFYLKDIIDLNILVDMDEKAILHGKSSELNLRDRNIYQNIPENLRDEKDLLLYWLQHRRQSIENQGKKYNIPHGKVPTDSEQKPFLAGGLIEAFIHQTSRILLLLGILSGFITVYSFLAYHGVQPVNVTLFFALFVVFPLLTCVISAGLLPINFIRKDNIAKSEIGIHRYCFQMIVNFLPRIMKNYSREKLSEINQSQAMQAVNIIRNKRTQYSHFFFWPIIGIMSSLALGFAGGSLLATIFRVVTADMAFGWQSTITTSSHHIQKIVSMVALPWSWTLPQALPTMEQIEGSRIILKQGISTLNTQHLASWWPFLSMSIMTYTAVPRLIFIIISKINFYLSIKNYDFNRPEFRKLIIRMEAPIVETHHRADSAICSNSLSDTRIIIQTDQNSSKTDNTAKEPMVALPNHERQTKSLPDKLEIPINNSSTINLSPGLLLVPKDIFIESTLNYCSKLIQQKLKFAIKKTIPLTMDIPKDQKTLFSLGTDTENEILILQEIWQPPIRGLLYYYTQIADTVFPGKTIWLILVPDMNLKKTIPTDQDRLETDIWYKAIQNLGHPALTIEKME